MPRAQPASVSFECAGHPSITGRHTKTLELALEPAVGPRATCVVGVASRPDWDALRATRGHVVIELAVGDHRDEVRAETNPFFAPGERIVVRRSTSRLPDTFAVSADKAASDLDRSLVAALADPAARLVVTIRPDPARAPRAALAVLVTGPDGELRAPAVAVARASDVAVAPPAARAALDGVATVGPARARAEAAAAIDAGGRVAIVVQPESPPAWFTAIVELASERGALVAATRGPGVVLTALALCAAGSEGYVHLGSLPPQDRRAAELVGASVGFAGRATVCEVRGGDLDRVLRIVGERARGRLVCVAVGSAGALDEVVRGDAGSVVPAARVGPEGRAVVVVAAPSGDADSPWAGPLVDALLAQGVGARAVHRALRAVPGLAGWRYEDVAARSARRSTDPADGSTGSTAGSMDATTASADRPTEGSMRPRPGAPPA